MSWIPKMKILITGSNGFIARNMAIRLKEAGYSDILNVDRNTTLSELTVSIGQADFILHLAGVNRPKNELEFTEGNANFTKKIVDTLIKLGKATPIMLSSSIQANLNNAYGKSKALAEDLVKSYSEKSGAPYYIYQLPNVFGKWCRPNYNSFIATFCYNIANGKDIVVSDPDKKVNLVYIDDVCDNILELIANPAEPGYRTISPIYSVSIGEVATLLYKFKESRHNLITENVGEGFIRALYSTWLSYFSPEQFSYNVPSYVDTRGTFCEMLKTKSAGQFSYFTAHPGVTRGGHYHHTKNEKFLVMSGSALFKFRNIITDEYFELKVDSSDFKIVETIPGWSHDITNCGDSELVVMLWANEIFDREKTDTIARSLS